MPFDQPTRNLLARFVGNARALLTEEFTRQLQQEYGLDPERGDVTDLSRLGHLDDARRATALLLRETLAYYLAAQPKPDAKARREALDRIVREQAFTILNRLCALRMAEGRGLLIESVGQGHRSQGFQLYGHLAGTGLGETGDAYRCYLFSLFDELALELPVLFDRYAPEGRLFPREVALSQVLALINAPRSHPCGPRMKPLAGSTSTSTRSRSAGRCAPNRRPHGTAASWPCAASSSPRATWSNS